MMPSVLDSGDAQVVSADGTRIWAAQAGRAPADAPTIVFVPGYAFSSIIFAKQFQDEQLLARFCLITFEPRGQARSTAVSDDGNPWTPAKMAQDVEAVCQFYAATKVFLAGWSYGCIIACDVFACNLGHYIAGLIYMAGMPSKNVFFPCYSDATVAYYSPRMNDAALTDSDTVGRFYLAFVESCVVPSRRRALPYTLKTALVGSMALTTATQRRRESALRAQDPGKMLAAVPAIETLCILGTDDEVVKIDVIQAYLEEHYARLQTVRVPDTGHAPFWEDPAHVNKLIADFVARVSKM